jgi:hypothetical protein
MSEHMIPPPAANEPDAARKADEMISEFAAIGVEIDGEAQVCESTWVVYGHTSYDGEVVVGEYQDAAEATEVLRAARRQRPEEPRHDRPVP